VNRENDPELYGIKQNLEKGKLLGFIAHENGTLRSYAPKNVVVRKQILEEVHSTRYLIHL